MRFCADHSVHGGLVRALLSADADVVSAHKLGPMARDSEVLAFAARDNRILIAEDSDFGALVFQRNDPCVGVVYLRVRIFSAQDAQETAERILALPAYGRGAFTTLDRDGVRSRPLP